MSALVARVARAWRRHAAESKALGVFVAEMRAENAQLRDDIAQLAADVALVKAERELIRAWDSWGRADLDALADLADRNFRTDLEEF